MHIAGAGISVRAGIPDFRSSEGLFQTLKKDHPTLSSGKDLFDASVFSVSLHPVLTVWIGRLLPATWHSSCCERALHSRRRYRAVATCWPRLGHAWSTRYTTNLNDVDTSMQVLYARTLSVLGGENWVKPIKCCQGIGAGCTVPPATIEHMQYSTACEYIACGCVPTFLTPSRGRYPEGLLYVLLM